jgi:transcriptional regulator with XRE-family HTH domain
MIMPVKSSGVDEKSRIAKALRWYRVSRNLTQVQLATLAGLTPTTVFNLERAANTPKPETRAALSRALGLPGPEALLLPVPNDLTVSAGGEGGIDFQAVYRRAVADLRREMTVAYQADPDPDRALLRCEDVARRVNFITAALREGRIRGC